MRTLSRPMFKMGGPIKEGIMHGIREPRKSGGRTGFVNAGEVYKNKNVGSQDGRNWKFWETGLGKTIGGVGDALWYQIPGALADPFNLASNKLVEWTTGYHPGLSARKTIRRKKDALFGVDRANRMTDEDVNKNILFGMEFDATEGWRIPSMKKEIEKNITIKDDKSVKKVLTDAEKKLIEDAKLKNAKAAKDKRVNDLLEIMGYDKSKNDAVSKALIDASQIIGERGTLSKKNITRELINPIIAATGKRLEKPEQIREAVGLMMAKGEIEKDIAKGKGSQTAQTARDLVEEGVFPNMRSALDHLSKKVDIADTIAAFAAKGVPTTASSLDIALRSEIKGVIPHVVMENKEWKKVSDGKSELEYVQEIIKDKKPGYYIIDKRIVFVDNEGKATYKW